MPTPVPDDQSSPESRLIMSFDVRLYYLQSEARGGPEFPPRLLDHRTFSHRAELPVAPFASRGNHPPPSPAAWAIVSSTLDGMRLPFLLDQLRWLDLGAGSNAAKKCLTRDELVSEIAGVASGAVNSPRNEGRKRMMIAVSMMHKVMISEREFREMRAQLRRLELQYLHSRMLGEEARGRRFPILERRLLLNLMRQEGLVANPDHGREDVRRRRRRRVRRESPDQPATNFEATRESIIQSLNKVVFEGDRRSSGRELDCVICKEEVAAGDQLVRLDCTHEFHGDCIETWLRIHHTCPLCRYKLPTEKS
ncbi:hypothetical protein NL676_020893 [Syzygium grande]|nr:hypothetical protein NL676_020893 [Syzygium grande]